MACWSAGEVKGAECISVPVCGFRTNVISTRNAKRVTCHEPLTPLLQQDIGGTGTGPDFSQASRILRIA